MFIKILEDNRQLKHAVSKGLQVSPSPFPKSLNYLAIVNAKCANKSSDLHICGTLDL